MGRYIVRRLLWLIIVLAVVSAVTFALMHAVPGGPFDSDKQLPPEIIANLEKKYHLDEPLAKQYLRYIGDIVLPRYTAGPPSTSLQSDYLINVKLGDGHLQWMNFGPSYKSKSRTVNDIFRDNLPVSAQLGVLALSLSVAMGIPLGVLSALRQNTLWDYFGMSVAIVGVSVPVIVLGPLFIWLFAVAPSQSANPSIRALALPVSGWNSLKHMIMPAVALGVGSSALIARLTRASLLQVIREDYIRTARAKGLRERIVVIRHALRNSLIPVVTVLGPLFAALVTGTFVTETIFGVPGMGRYFVTSIGDRDYPVIMGTILLYAVFLVIANLVVDIAYAYLDPRIRYT